MIGNQRGHNDSSLLGLQWLADNQYNRVVKWEKIISSEWIFFNPDKWFVRVESTFGLFPVVVDLWIFVIDYY